MQARLHAASDAAKRGAVAVLVRSVTAVSLGTPHTGALNYEDGVRKIPAAAVSTEDADLLDRFARRGAVEVELTLGAQMLHDVPSANVIGELRGRELPDEIVLLGAHIDSWDVGPGASDDAAGCIAIMEALRLLRAGGLTPRRTVRAVLFTGEEYGLAGARAYKQQYGDEHHVAAFETDYGMAAPDAIGVGNEARVAAMDPLLPAFAPFGIQRFKPHAYGVGRRTHRRDRRAGVRPRACRTPLLRHPPQRRGHTRQDPARGPAPQRRARSRCWRTSWPKPKTLHGFHGAKMDCRDLSFRNTGATPEWRC